MECIKEENDFYSRRRRFFCGWKSERRCSKLKKRKGGDALNINRGEEKMMLETKTSGEDAIIIKQEEGM